MNVQMLKDSNRIIYEFISGSHSYGLNTPTSDVDVRGLFYRTIPELLSIKPPPPDPISDDKQDISYYSIRRFFELAKDVNPNICEFLYIPDQFVKVKTPLMNLILKNRHLFISKKAKFTFSGYAYQQVSKAKGENKWINNPKPEAKPLREDFCWVIPDQDAYDFFDDFQDLPPFRPVPLKRWEQVVGLKLDQCMCSSVEHTPNQFRLYNYGNKSKGVFRDGNIVVESIPLEDEHNLYCGTLIYNENAYNSEKRDWKNYWDWKRNRNEARWVQQESGELDFDAKNMCHCIRILKSGNNILRNGEPIIFWTGAEQKLLMDIRQGKIKFDDIMKMSDDLKQEMEELYISSNIPHSCDLDKIDQLYLEIMNEIDRENLRQAMIEISEIKRRENQSLFDELKRIEEASKG